MRRRTALRPSNCIQLVLGLVSLIGAALAHAQPYPNRPITVVIPWPTGGGSDVLGRVIMQRLGDRLKQTIVIENRPGASATLGTGRVAKAAPDGYTLLFTAQTPVTIAANFQEKPAYDAAKELMAVSMAVISPTLIVVPSALPVRNLKEFSDYVRANPNKTNFGAAGLSNELRLIWELLRAEMRLDTVTIPYQGAGPVVIDLAAGRVQVSALSPSSVRPYIVDGRVRALAIVDDKRHPEFPDVGTLAENGLPNVVVPTVWWGTLAPAGTPPEIVERLHRELAEIANEPTYRKRVADLGLDLAPLGPKEFGALLDHNRTAWAALIKAQGLRIDAN